MPGLPSPSGLRNAAVACIAGAGVALVGLSLANVASIDGTLAAATPAPAVVHSTDVRFQTPRDCPRTHHRPAASADQQY
jgi:hypothetical protein